MHPVETPLEHAVDTSQERFVAAMHDLLVEMGCKLREYEWPDYWYFGKERRLMGSDQKDDELERLHELMASVGQEECPERDISALDWLRSKGATDKMVAAAEACYANDFGCSLRQMGLREMITENRSWDSGETYLILDRSLRALPAHLAAPLGSRLRTGCPVTRIEYGSPSSRVLPKTLDSAAAASAAAPDASAWRADASNANSNVGATANSIAGSNSQTAPRKGTEHDAAGAGGAAGALPPPERSILDMATGGIGAARGSPTADADGPAAGVRTGGATLLCAGGQQIRAGRVVMAVPVTVLQRQDIVFSPPLPERKQAAIQRIKMSSAVKVLLAFSEPFWPEGFFDVVCTDCFIPEFWVTRYPAADGASSSGRSNSAGGSGELHAMVGFLAGEAAEAAGAMRQSEVVRKALAQLDEMFGKAPKHKPATAAYVKAAVVDWAQEPFIHGAYSYPTLGAEPGDREALGAPVGSVLFFAGEATHPAVNPCIQAALETGQRAAAQVLAAAQQPVSRL